MGPKSKKLTKKKSFPVNKPTFNSLIKDSSNNSKCNKLSIVHHADAGLIQSSSSILQPSNIQTNSIKSPVPGPSGIQMTKMKSLVPGPSGIQKYFNVLSIAERERSTSSISSSNSSVVTIIPTCNLSPKTKLFLPVDQLNFSKKIVESKISTSSLQLYSNINEILKTIYQNTIKSEDLPNFILKFLMSMNQNNFPKKFVNFKFSPNIWLTDHDRFLLRTHNISNCVIKINDNNFLHQFILYFIKKSKEEKQKLFNCDKKYLHQEFSKAFHFELQKRGSVEVLLHQYYRKRRKEQTKMILNVMGSNSVVMESNSNAMESNSVVMESNSNASYNDACVTKKRRVIGPKFFKDKLIMLQGCSDAGSNSTSVSRIKKVIGPKFFKDKLIMLQGCSDAGSNSTSVSRIKKVVGPKFFMEKKKNLELINLSVELETVETTPPQSERTIVTELVSEQEKVVIGPKFYMQKKKNLESINLSVELETVEKTLPQSERTIVTELVSEQAIDNQKLTNERSQFIGSIVLKDMVNLNNMLLDQADNLPKNLGTMHLHQSNDQIINPENLPFSFPKRKILDYLKRSFSYLPMFEFDFNNLCNLYAEAQHFRKCYNFYHSKLMDSLSKIQLKEDVSDINWDMSLTEFCKNTDIKLFITNVYHMSNEKKKCLIEHLIEEFYEKVYLKKQWYTGLNIISNNNQETSIEQSSEIISSSSNVCNSSRNLFADITNSSCENNLEICENNLEICENNLEIHENNLEICENNLEICENSLNELLESNNPVITNSGNSLIKLLEADGGTIDQNKCLLGKKIMEHALGSNHNKNSDNSSENILIISQNIENTSKNVELLSGNSPTEEYLNLTENPNVAQNFKLEQELDDNLVSVEHLEADPHFSEIKNCNKFNCADNGFETLVGAAGIQTTLKEKSSIYLIDEIGVEISNIYHEILLSNKNSNAKEIFNLPDPLAISNNQLSASNEHYENSDKSSQDELSSQNIGVPLAQSTQSTPIEIIILNKDLTEKEVKQELIDANYSYNSEEVQYIPISSQPVVEISEEEEEDIDVLLNEIGRTCAGGKHNNNVNKDQTPVYLNEDTILNPPIFLKNDPKPLDSRYVNLKPRKPRKPRKQNVIKLNENPEFVMQTRHNFNQLNLVSSTKGVIINQTESGPKPKKKIVQKKQNELELCIEDASQVLSETLTLESETQFNVCNTTNSSSTQQILDKFIISEKKLDENLKASIEIIEDMSNCINANTVIINSLQNIISNAPSRIEMNSFCSETASQLLNKDNTYFNYNFSQFDEDIEKTKENSTTKKYVNVNLKSNEQFGNVNESIELLSGFKRKYSQRDDYNFNETAQPVLKKMKFSSSTNNSNHIAVRNDRRIELPYTIPLNPLKFITNLNLVEINLNKDIHSLKYSSKSSFFNHFPDELMQATISLGHKNYLHITGKNSLKFLLNLKSNTWNDIQIILNDIKAFQYRRKTESITDYLPYQILHNFFETIPKFSQVTYRKIDSHEDYIQCVHIFNNGNKTNLLNMFDSPILHTMEQFKKKLRKE